MKQFAGIVLELMEADDAIHVIDADLSRSSGTVEVRSRHPDRFLNVGVAEQNAIGVAGGLALMGLKPIVHTYAAFASMRACEQIRTTLAYQRLGVIICASKGGLAASHAGPTHHALEDLAIMRAIPGMNVIAPKDFADVRVLLQDALGREGPCYLRIPPDRGLEVAATSAVTPRRGVVVREGGDVVIVATGTMVEIASSAADGLAERGICAGVLYYPTLKPFDAELLVERCRGAALVLTLEEHSVIGGLGSAVAECLSERAPTAVLRLGVQDRFCYDSGPHDEMLAAHCVSADTVVRAAADRLQRLTA